MAPLLNVHNWVREILQDCGKATLLQALAIGGKASKAVEERDASNRSLPLSCILREPESTHMTNHEVIKTDRTHALFYWGQIKISQVQDILNGTLQKSCADAPQPTSPPQPLRLAASLETPSSLMWCNASLLSSQRQAHNRG